MDGDLSNSVIKGQSKIIFQAIFHISGEISIIQGNKYIQFWSGGTKPRTEYCAEKNCDDRQRGTVCNKLNSVKRTVRISNFFAKSCKIN